MGCYHDPNVVDPPWPNFSLYLSQSRTASTACQLGLWDFGRNSSDFFHLSVFFFSAAFYKYDAYGRKPFER
jgi:hypothetical protein